MTDTFITKLQNKELTILEIMVAYSDYRALIQDIEKDLKTNLISKQQKIKDQKLLKTLQKTCDIIINFISKETSQN